MSSLYKKLVELSQSDIYPFHMPGHKRNMQGRPLESLYDIDITEIEGFDNLHHAEGILKELQERAGRLYGGYKTWISVNGSTAGILSAISAVCGEADTIILDRGSHKSAYNACALKQLNTIFAYPEISYKQSAVRGGIVAEEIERLIQLNQPKAVFITSPTYDGVVSDIKKIADACHREGIPLIVDEAHGAHFFLDDRFPEDALSQGADIVIHSIHKTLLAPTQTALVHMQGSLISSHSLDTYMGLYQTSSPSYVLMAAIEQCLDILENEGKALSDSYFKNLEKFYQKTSKLKNISLLVSDSFRDKSKIIISSNNDKISGVALGKLLRSRYHIEPEMVVPDYVCALSTIMDRPEGFKRLANAILDMDAYIEKSISKDIKTCTGAGTVENISQRTYGEGEPSRKLRELSVLEVSSIFTDQRGWRQGHVMDLDAAKCRSSLDNSIGRKSGAFVQLYPPGIPMLVPGEIITEQSVRLIKLYRECGLLVEGIDEDEIWILK